MRVPWTARRSSQSILKEINPEYSLEGLMLKLKLQYFGHHKELTPWKKSMTKVDNILKSRYFTLPAKVRMVKAIVFLVVVYQIENSWTKKKTEC